MSHQSDRVLADQQDREQETLIQAADANLPIGETVGIRCMGHGAEGWMDIGSSMDLTCRHVLVMRRKGRSRYLL